MANGGSTKFPGEPWIGPKPVGGSYSSEFASPFRVEKAMEIDRGDNRINCFESSTIQEFSNKREIGRGRNTLVYAALHTATGQQVAIKAYLKRALSPTDMKRVRREVHIIHKLSHKHIIRWLGNFEDESCVYLVQEWAPNGDLFEEIRSSRGLMSEMRVVTQVLVPLISAIRYMHDQGIIHRDIKPENILLAKDRTIKVCDFGLAIDTRAERPISRLGTLQYMAPEVIRRPLQRPRDPSQVEPYDERVDIWACGILVYELIIGRPPFEGVSDAVTTRNIIHMELEVLPKYLSQACKDFLRQVLQKKASDRLDLDRMLGHPFVRSYTGAPFINRDRMPAVILPTPHSNQLTMNSHLVIALPQPEVEPNACDTTLPHYQFSNESNSASVCTITSEPKAFSHEEKFLPETPAMALAISPLGEVELGHDSISENTTFDKVSQDSQATHKSVSHQASVSPPTAKQIWYSKINLIDKFSALFNDDEPKAEATSLLNRDKQNPANKFFSFIGMSSHK